MKIDYSSFYLKTDSDIHFFATEEQAIFWAENINCKIDINFVIDNIKRIYFNVYVIKHCYFDGNTIIENNFQYNIQDYQDVILKFQELKSLKLVSNTVLLIGISDNISVVLDS
jgi:hypothetical protein